MGLWFFSTSTTLNEYLYWFADPAQVITGGVHVKRGLRGLVTINNVQAGDGEPAEVQEGGADNACPPSVSDAERKFLEKVTRISDNLLDNHRLDVTSLADRLCMSPRQLHRKLSALTGSSPASYVQKFKMRRARHLLRSKPEMAVEEIAGRCGFEHSSNFYNAFKKAYGITPMEYRCGKGGE